jgi:hypothetical protein
LDKYQEQPQLLDPHLSHIIEPLLHLIRKQFVNITFHNVENAKEKVDRLGPIFKVLYLLCKTRGYKTIVKFFSHEVSDLEPLLEFTENVSQLRLQYWETYYVLLLWLSIVCMIPFDLKTVDSQLESQKNSKSLAERVLELAKQYVVGVGREYEAAAVLLMRLLTRQDVAPLYLMSTVKWAVERLLRTQNTFEVSPLFFLFTYIFNQNKVARYLTIFVFDL